MFFSKEGMYPSPVFALREEGVKEGAHDASVLQSWVIYMISYSKQWVAVVFSFSAVFCAPAWADDPPPQPELPPICGMPKCEPGSVPVTDLSKGDRCSYKCERVLSGDFSNDCDPASPATPRYPWEPVPEVGVCPALDDPWGP